MNGKDILMGLGYVDEELVHEAEISKLNNNRKFMKYAFAIASSSAVVMLSLALFKNGGTTTPVNPNPDNMLPSISESVENTENRENTEITEITENTNASTSYKLQFNNAHMVSASKIAIKGHFWYELDAEQAKKVLPIISQKYEMEGAAHYSSEDGKADLYEITASVTVDENISGKITISPNEIENDYVITGEPIISQIEDIPVEAGLFITDKNSKGERNYIYYADFKLDGIHCYVEFVSKNQKADDVFTSIAADIILGGKADLSIFDNPAVPVIIEKSLTESEAYNEADFGKYLIKIPSGYLFNGANRLLNQNSDLLYASWSKGYDDVRIHVSRLDDDSKARIVSPDDTTLFDMSLYSIPWADSMPRDKYHIIENPVFRIEDLTLDIITLRGYIRNEAGDPSGDSLNLRFSVLYDDIVVEVHSEGLSAEYLFDKLSLIIQ